jgi:hypothetical protein
MKHFIPIIFLLVCACKDKFPVIPKGVIGVEKMKAIMVDMHVADAVAETKAQMGGDERTLTQSYHAQIFKNHDVTREDFLKSFKFYESEPVLLNRMYDEILAEISKREAEVAKK